MFAPPEADARSTAARCDVAGETDVAREIADLRSALRDSRLRLRRGAWESTRQITRLDAEVTRLQALCESYRRQVECYETGAALFRLGQKLMHGVASSELIDESNHRLASLRQILADACDECRRLAGERETLMRKSYPSRREHTPTEARR